MSTRDYVFSAALELALEKQLGSYWRGFSIDDVLEQIEEHGGLEAEPSRRTVRRVLGNMVALEWLEKRHKNGSRWRPGPKLEAFAEEQREQLREKVTASLTREP